MNRKIIVIAAGAALLIAVAIGLWFVLDRDATTSSERKVLYWTDPMVPGYRSDKPGKSPFMDMELVPVYEDEAGGDGAPVVTVRTDVAQNLAVRTATVTRAVATRSLSAHGYLFREAGGWVVIADVFGQDSTWLRAGFAAEVLVSEIPGQKFAAVLERIESDRDIGGRSVKTRVRLQRTDSRMQANMSAEAVIRAPGTNRTLLVPREALIRTGHRSVLIRVLDGGRFQPVEVVVGEDYGEQIEIKSGVTEGEKIVVSGQFLIDSEASVRESLKRMDTPADPAPDAAHKH